MGFMVVCGAETTDRLFGICAQGFDSPGIGTGEGNCFQEYCSVWHTFDHYVSIFLSKIGRDLVPTQCRVNRVEVLQEGSCSHRTEKYQPCIKIFVSGCSKTQSGDRLMY